MRRRKFRVRTGGYMFWSTSKLFHAFYAAPALNRPHFLSAGIVGPVSRFFNDTSAPQHQDAETLGRAMFEESTDGWSDVYRSNTLPIYFVTMAFLGLLAKGSEDTQGYTSCVVNITSISGIIKVAQCHVRGSIPSFHFLLSSCPCCCMNEHDPDGPLIKTRVHDSSDTTARKQLRPTCPRCSRRSSR